LRQAREARFGQGLHVSILLEKAAWRRDGHLFSTSDKKGIVVGHDGKQGLDRQVFIPGCRQTIVVRLEY
jgi:hypothetical protein